MIRSTTKEAFNSHKADRLTMCVEMLGIYRKYGNLTDKEFLSLSGWDINQVTARRNDLLKKKDCWGNAIPDVEAKFKKKNDKNRSVIVWGLVSSRQGELFNG